jgi:hypothetical protein
MVQEVETQSYFTRIKNAFIGIIFGIVLIIASFVLIFWNEHHGLTTALSLEQAQKVLVAIPNSPIASQNNLKVVYLSGLATTNDNLVDSIFGEYKQVIKLERDVKMYQWKENVSTRTEKETGGSEKEIKTYTYEKVWSAEPIDSSQFKDQNGHTNPSAIPLASRTQYAEKVTVGDFLLPRDLVTQINNPVSIDLSNTNLATLKEKLNKPVAHLSDQIYVGSNADSPSIGDLEINLYKVLPQTVSIIAQQTDQTLQPYVAPAGQDVMLLETGQHSSQELIGNAESENQLLTWVLRAASLLMMIFGISLLMQPLVVIADVLPFLGSIVGLGTGFVAFASGLVIWSIATGVAWFAIRPLWSIGLILIAISISVAVHFSRK